MKRLLNKHFFIVTIGMVVGLLLSFYLIYSEDIDISYPFLVNLSSAWIGVLLCYLLYTNSLWLDRILPWQNWGGIRLISGVLANSLICFCVGMAMLWSYKLIVTSGEQLTDTDIQLAIKLGIMILGVAIVFSIAYFALFSYQQYARTQIEKVRIEGTQIDLKLNALKSQLSPHFMFNGFNTISALIQQDIQKAEYFIRELAKLYHYTLESYSRDWVSLKEELEFVQSYEYLLRTRFEHSLDICIRIPSELMDKAVLPLTIQMLVENAVKHNQLSIDTPLHISIEANQQWVWVKNNKTLKPHHVTSLGIGLSNIKSRYQVMTGRDIVVKDKQDFTVKIPLIAGANKEVQQTRME